MGNTNNKTRTLSKGLRRIPIKTKGGFQQLNCLRIDLVALWLAGAQPGSVKSEFRAKIEVYQDELAPVATQVFMRVMGLQTRDIIPSTDPQIIALADRVDTLTEITALVREYMETLLEAQGHTSMQLEQAITLLEALSTRQDVTENQVAKIDERTQRLTPAHGKDVQEIVDLIAAAIQKQSPNITPQLGVTTFLPCRIPAKQREIRATGVRQASSYGDPLGKLVVITYLKSKLLLSGSLATQTPHQRQLL